MLPRVFLADAVLRAEELVGLSTHARVIHSRESAVPGNQFLGAQAPPAGEWTQLGDFGAVAGDVVGLPRLDGIHHGRRVVAELALGDDLHGYHRSTACPVELRDEGKAKGKRHAEAGPLVGLWHPMAEPLSSVQRVEFFGVEDDVEFAQRGVEAIGGRYEGVLEAVPAPVPVHELVAEHVQSQPAMHSEHDVDILERDGAYVRLVQ